MQETIGLPGAVIHGHAAFEEVFTDFRKFHAEVFGHGISAQRLDMGKVRSRIKPDSHNCQVFGIF